LQFFRGHSAPWTKPDRTPQRGRFRVVLGDLNLLICDYLGITRAVVILP
jgi:hypothetical protein